MRIIDKNQDFYDYLQDPTDTLVFDRRGSFLLTKEKFCNGLSIYNLKDSKYRFILLQCGATFWLMLATITDYKTTGSIENYNLEILNTWKNYDRQNELLKIDIIGFNKLYKMYDYKAHDYLYDRIKENVSDITLAINHNDFRICGTISRHITISDKYPFERKEQSIPLLKACGIGNIIDPQAIFCAIEEYFSIEKTKSETTEAKGATNNDKIIMHGFDTKTSFRGKR